MSLIAPVLVVAIVENDVGDFFPKVFVVDVGGDAEFSFPSSRRLLVLTPPKS